MLFSKKSVVAWALGLALLAGSSEGVSAQARGGGRGGPPMTPFVYRQNIMEQLQQSMGALTAIRNGAVGAPSHLLGRATIVQQLSLALSDAFPPNSVGEGSRALPAIWENPAELGTRIQALQTAAEALVEAARAGNAEGVAAAQTSVQQSCAGCHMQFRGPAAGA